MQSHRPRQFRRLHRSSPPFAQSPLEDIRFIRETMERSSAFTAVPGWGQVAMGATAIMAAWFAAQQTAQANWLAVWLGEALLAISVALVGSQRKAQHAGVPLTSGPGS